MLKWYIITPLILLVVFIYMVIQAAVYKTRYYSLDFGAGLRLLHLTDIHINLLLISSARLRKTIKQSNPDYVLISGDLIEKPENMKKFADWYKGLDIRVPVYIVFGNHEHKCFRETPSFKDEFVNTIKKLDMHLLINEWVFIQGKRLDSSGKAKKIAVVGIDDLKTGKRVNNHIFTGLRDKCDTIIAFSHNPDISLYIPENSVDLLLTGHFHGGQIWMPFKLEYLLLRKDKLSRMGHIKGFATIRENLVYISRGLGTVLFPFRFFSIPEVTVIDI